MLKGYLDVVADPEALLGGGAAPVAWFWGCECCQQLVNFWWDDTLPTPLNPPGTGNVTGVKLWQEGVLTNLLKNGIPGTGAAQVTSIARFDINPNDEDGTIAAFGIATQAPQAPTLFVYPAVGLSPDLAQNGTNPKFSVKSSIAMNPTDDNGLYTHEVIGNIGVAANPDGGFLLARQHTLFQRVVYDTTGVHEDWSIDVERVASGSPIIQQLLPIQGWWLSGTFAVDWVAPDTQHITTAGVPFSATAAQLQAAMRVLPEMALVTVSETGTVPNQTYTVTFDVSSGGPLNLLNILNSILTMPFNGPQPGMTFAVTRTQQGNGSIPEIHQIAVTHATTDPRTYKISWVDSTGQTFITDSLPPDADQSQVQAALTALPPFSGVTVQTSGTSIFDAPYIVHNVNFGDFAGSMNSLVAVLDDGGDPLGGSGTVTARQSSFAQRIIVSGSPTSGTYKIGWTDPTGGTLQQTSPLAFNASASDVQSALAALPGIGGGNVTVTSTGVSPNISLTIVFSQSIPGIIVPLTVLNATNLGAFTILQVQQQYENQTITLNNGGMGQLGGYLFLSVNWVNPYDQLAQTGALLDGGSTTTDQTLNSWGPQLATVLQGSTFAGGNPITDAVTIGSMFVIVTISGTPTSGSYLLKWTDHNGATFTTSAIAYNATGSTVLSALEALPGLSGNVTLQSSSGSSPNWQHQLHFINNCWGSLSTVSAVNSLNQGSVGASPLTGFDSPYPCIHNITFNGFPGPVDLIDVTDMIGAIREVSPLRMFWEIVKVPDGIDEVQSIAVTGDPSSGTYTISWTHPPSGAINTTVPLIYNASGGDVESALQTLLDMRAVTVETTGSTPNFTHKVRFRGYDGPQAALLQINNSTDTGVFNVTRTTPGVAAEAPSVISTYDPYGSQRYSYFAPYTVPTYYSAQDIQFYQFAGVTSGTFSIEWKDQTNTEYSTGDLPHDADPNPGGSGPVYVQDALRTIPGLSAVTTGLITGGTESGSELVQIDFGGIPGPNNLISITNNTNGTITVSSGIQLGGPPNVSIDQVINVGYSNFASTLISTNGDGKLFWPHSELVQVQKTQTQTITLDARGDTNTTASGTFTVKFHDPFGNDYETPDTYAEIATGAGQYQLQWIIPVPNSTPQQFAVGTSSFIYSFSNQAQVQAAMTAVAGGVNQTGGGAFALTATVTTTGTGPEMSHAIAIHGATGNLPPISVVTSNLGANTVGCAPAWKGLFVEGLDFTVNSNGSGDSQEIVIAPNSNFALNLQDAFNITPGYIPVTSMSSGPGFQIGCGISAGTDGSNNNIIGYYGGNNGPGNNTGYFLQYTLTFPYRVEVDAVTIGSNSSSIDPVVDVVQGYDTVHQEPWGYWATDSGGADFVNVPTQTQTINIVRAPSSGPYNISVVGDNITQFLNHLSDPIPIGSNASEIQAILRNIPGLETVTVGTADVQPTIFIYVMLSGAYYPWTEFSGGGGDGLYQFALVSPVQSPSWCDCYSSGKFVAVAGICFTGDEETATVAPYQGVGAAPVIATDDSIYSIGGDPNKKPAPVGVVMIGLSPTGGSYTLTVKNPQNVSNTTAAIAYNASSDDVQAALRLLPGCEKFLVVDLGSSPDDEFIIIMKGFEGETFHTITLTATNSTTVPTPAVGIAVVQINAEIESLQRITITGTPTAGTYTIKWTDPSGGNHTTAAIAYNADQAAVQAAVQATSGMSTVTVSTTGTSPNFVHTLTFVGLGGPLNLLTIANSTTGGSFATLLFSSGFYQRVGLNFTGQVTNPGGTFKINWVDNNGNSFQSSALPYNATQAQIQTAVRAMTSQFAQVTVTSQPALTLTTVVNNFGEQGGLTTQFSQEPFLTMIGLGFVANNLITITNNTTGAGSISAQVAQLPGNLIKTDNNFKTQWAIQTQYAVTGLVLPPGSDTLFSLEQVRDRTMFIDAYSTDDGLVEPERIVSTDLDGISQGIPPMNDGGRAAIG